MNTNEHDKEDTEKCPYIAGMYLSIEAKAPVCKECCENKTCMHSQFFQNVELCLKLYIHVFCINQFGKENAMITKVV